MSQNKINLSDVKRIISEEIKNLQEQKEKAEHELKVDVVRHAGDLLTAVQNFKKTASPTVVGAVAEYLDSLENALQNMCDKPGSYVMKIKPKPTMKKVSLKPTK